MNLKFSGVLVCSGVALNALFMVPPAQVALAQPLLIPAEAPEPYRATAETFNAQGVESAKRGDFRGAIAAFSKAIQVDAQFDAAYNNRGFARYKLGDAQGAFEDLNRAIWLNANDPLAFYNRAIVRYQLKAFRSAIADFTESLKLNPTNPLTYYSRAVAWMRLKNYKYAAQDLQQAAALQQEQGDQQGYEQTQALIKKLGTAVN